MATIQHGSRVEVTGIRTLPDEYMSENGLESYFGERYIGARGVVTECDGIMYTVILDLFQNDGPIVFMYDELKEVTELTQGGEIALKYTSITDAYVLGQGDLSVYEKLTFFIIKNEDPADLEIICDTLNTSLEFAKKCAEKLVSLGICSKSKGEIGLYYPAFHIMHGAEPKKEKKKEKEEEKVTESQTDKDILLFMAALQRYYKQKGVGYKISKNGKKHIAKAVYFLEGQWKNKKDKPELEQFDIKSDMYQAFVEYVFRDVPKSDLNLLKRLHYSGTKRGWKAWLTKPGYQFTPVLLEKKTDKDTFLGVLKRDIPPAQNLKKSGYWYTVKVFLKNRWDNGDYPIAKQVLYALEMCIVFMLFRKTGIEGTDVAKLLVMHNKYAREYHAAVITKRLDDLATYVKDNKMQSTLCHNCKKKSGCAIYKSNAVVVNCTQRTV